MDKNLKKRLVTAAVFVPALWMALLLDPTIWSILVFSLFAAALSGDEFLCIALPRRDDDPALGLRATFGVLSVTVVALSTFLSPVLVAGPFVAFATIVLSIVILLRRSQLAQGGRHLAVTLAGLLYVPMLASMWPALKYEFGGGWLYVALSTAFFSDVFAYFAGRAFGRHELYAEVSPKKTIEGSIGGLFGGILATVGCGSFWLVPELPITHALVLGVVGSVFGQVGDLVESMIKRSFEVKDSGTVLPGHGGMLDRIDSVLFAVPLVYFYCAWFVEPNQPPGPSIFCSWPLLLP